MKSLVKQRLFDKHYKKLVENTSKRSKGSSINNCASATILVSGAHHRADDLRKAAKLLAQQGIKSHLYMITSNPEGNDDEGVTVISKSDCSWYDVPSQEVLIDWLAQKTDILIADNPKGAPLLLYLTASSNSRLKTSIEYKGQHDPAIDFYVSTDNPLEMPLHKKCELIYQTLLHIGQFDTSL